MEVGGLITNHQSTIVIVQDSMLDVESSMFDVHSSFFRIQDLGLLKVNNRKTTLNL